MGKKFFFSLAMWSIALPSFALDGISFEHKDWQLACDNTGTCRVAGYSEESSDTLFSVLVERQAGEHAPVKFFLKTEVYENYNDDPNKHIQFSPAELWLNKQIIAKDLDINKEKVELTDQALIRQIISTLAEDGELELKTEQRNFKLSNQGAKAVLLKMDEFQQRLDHPSALVRQGNSQNPVLAPQKLLIINSPKLAEEQEIKMIDPEHPKLKALFEQHGCYHVIDFTLVKLNAHHVLVSGTCNLYAYNESYLNLIMDSQLSNVIEELSSEGYYFDGQLILSAKGRGLGDCWKRKVWTWNGDEFQLSNDSTTGMCRGFVGGAWHLPTFVSKVIEEK